MEIELDDGSAWRLGPDSQVEISDYAQLSTGQRITVLSLDHGVAYFTGEPGGADTLTLAVPGAQATLLRGARVRLQADATMSRISVIEGAVRLSCPAAEIDIREGQTARVEPANTARFWLDREMPAMELDRWNEDRDKTLATSSSSVHVAQRYGLVDLDGAGEWVQTDLGAVWKPKVADGWAPFQNGRWRWYDALGYTWVSDEAWGWVPYHHGRWTRSGDLGWVWVPASSPVFKPGDVYWLYNAKLAGWGPLAPGEDWQPSAAPAAVPQRQYDVRELSAGRARDRSGGIQRSPEGTARRGGVRAGAAIAGIPGVAIGSHAAGAARGRHARTGGDPGDHVPGPERRSAARAAADASGGGHQSRVGCAAGGCARPAAGSGAARSADAGDLPGAGVYRHRGAEPAGASRLFAAQPEPAGSKDDTGPPVTRDWTGARRWAAAGDRIDTDVWRDEADDQAVADPSGGTVRRARDDDNDCAARTASRDPAGATFHTLG